MTYNNVKINKNDDITLENIINTLKWLKLFPKSKMKFYIYQE